jgi:hypothetical protein
MDESEEPVDDALARRATRDGLQLKFVLLASLVLIPVGFLVDGALGIGPAVAALEGHGTRGTFTATSQACGHGNCTWVGTFQPDNTTIEGSLDARIYGNHDPGTGYSIPAIDTGDGTYVYPIGGGGAWKGSAAELVIGGATLPPAMWYVILRPWRRKRKRRLDPQTGTPHLDGPLVREDGPDRLAEAETDRLPTRRQSTHVHRSRQQRNAASRRAGDH